MKNIQISTESYEKLGKIAENFETPEQVIEKLIKHYQNSEHQEFVQNFGAKKEKRNGTSNIYDTEQESIDKIHKRLPKWKGDSSLIPHKMIQSFFDVSVNKQTASKENMRKSFLNKQKHSSSQNYAKIFDYDKDTNTVTLWEPTKEYVESIWKN